MNPFPPNDTGPVIELLRFTAARGHRADLARRFDEVHAPAFQQLGGVAIGHFCERDRPGSVAWLRGFRTHAARTRITRAFDAQAPVAAEGAGVLLLRALHPGSALTLPPIANDAGGIVVAHILYVEAGLLGACARAAEACFAAYHGRGVIEAGILVTHDEHGPAPGWASPGRALPGRAFPGRAFPGRASPGAVLVWLGIVCDDAALAGLRPALDNAAGALAANGLLAAPGEVLVLDPCRRSRLRWVSAASVTAPAMAAA
ncbi:MAG TPA: hypothetical protein VF800_31700 [Telluria sp.]|jgi:hypothetical protein